VLALAAAAAACEDSTPPAKPASVKLLAGDAQTGTVGEALPLSPSFAVYDANGHALTGVKVTLVVTSGGGVLSNAPAKTAGTSTSVGVWKLGPRAGVNQVTLTVAGLPPLEITATARAGSAARIASSSPTSFSARVADPAPTVNARVLDAFDNAVAGAPVSVTLTGGGSVSAALVSDSDGNVTVSDWMLSHVAGPNTLTLASGAATLSLVANLSPAAPTQLLLVDGDEQKAPAGTVLQPIHLRVADRYGNGVPNQDVALNVSSGGGTLAMPYASTAADGIVTLPAWTLGRTALPQAVHVVFGTIGTLDLSATVQSDYDIDVRFFGPQMSDAQQALFTNAAARIRAVVVGDIPDARMVNSDASADCGVAGLPVLNETIDDLVIYASVQPIDGAGRILAEAGPCTFRPDAQGNLTAVGVMLFDSADVANMATQGILQDVITHEMLHVVGIGTLWSTKHLLAGEGTSSVSYLGTQGLTGCVDDGGTTTCAQSVPVENNGVPGTTDSHWRETTFGSELMTGYVNFGGMPLSAITVGSLGDMGYVVNPFGADPYRVPASTSSQNRIPTAPTGWEKRPIGRVMP
jgi:hypothetical protein